jgi:hypothetical protein
MKDCGPFVGCSLAESEFNLGLEFINMCGAISILWRVGRALLAD